MLGKAAWASPTMPPQHHRALRGLRSQLDSPPMSKPYTLYTMDNSPYSDKIRALLRYKRLEVVEHTENVETRFSVLQARTGKTMVPVVITPDDEALNDSTRIAARIEQLAPNPPLEWPDPVMETAAMILEDYADEWIVRIMLCSRWYHEADAAQNRAIIACGMTHGIYGIDFQQAAREFPNAIIATLPKMGATPENAPGWYAMVPRILAAMASALEASPFLTGSRPHLADFAFYGQLNQLRRDPTGHEWVCEGPAQVRQWLDRIEQPCTSAAPPQAGPARADAAALAPLLREAAQTYYRMAVANALALEQGAPAVRVELVEGFDFEAPPARYNRKVFADVLARIDALYAGGNRLPEELEAILLPELKPLRDTELIGEFPALGEQLAAA